MELMLLVCHFVMVRNAFKSLIFYIILIYLKQRTDCIYEEKLLFFSGTACMELIFPQLDWL